MTKHILDRAPNRSDDSRYRRFLKIDHDGQMARNTRALLQRPRKSSDQPRLSHFLRIEHEGLGSV
ncbi:hypothetical protein [Thioclava sp. GXIMD4216]|uniref:Uncharacterized protein n=1 Tax=Thioclava litoralis TaxID=3076557 RepID=A0ABZ1E2N1_9RHOB|nr:hypothetical protein RPE78_04185 [Thioclava sp. FTW29]